MYIISSVNATATVKAVHFQTIGWNLIFFYVLKQSYMPFLQSLDLPVSFGVCFHAWFR